MSGAIQMVEQRILETKRHITQNMTPWQRVQLSRHPDRPYTLKYISKMSNNFIELHGDRNIKDDKAMVGGFCDLDGETVMIIGQQKGINTKMRQLRNFGMANPEGYRKALRLMRMAEKFSLPIVTLIDTPGAFPGIGAEERNIAEAIAFNLREMMTLRTPVIAIVIGEGGSGGALGIGIADRVLMMENAYYSVISPEGCAAILWKHREHAPEAASALKLSAQDLSKLGIIDGIIPEPLGGAHNDHFAAANSLKDAVLATLKELNVIPTAQLLEQRYQKFRALGQFTEG